MLVKRESLSGLASMSLRLSGAVSSEFEPQLHNECDSQQQQQQPRLRLRESVLGADFGAFMN